MTTKNELLAKLSMHSLDAYEIIDETGIFNTVPLANLEILISFAHKHGVDSLFFCYSYYQYEDYAIDDEVISKLRLEPDVISVLESKFNEHNELLKCLDFSVPFMLNIYCFYQGFAFFVLEEDCWMERMPPPLIKAEEIVEECKEVISNVVKSLQEKFERETNIYRQRILNDKQFHRCTNVHLRRKYTAELVENDEHFKQLFCDNTTGRIVPIYPFIEEIWKTYKESLRKPESAY